MISTLYNLELAEKNIALLEMRSHIAWYLKGLPNSTEVKNACFMAKTSEELKKILNNYLKELKNII